MKKGPHEISLIFSGNGCDRTSLKMNYDFKEGSTYYLHINENGGIIDKASTRKPTDANGEFSLG